MPSSLVEVWFAQAGKAIRPGRADRLIDGFVYGFTKPTRANTGITGAGVQESQLSNYSGDITNAGTNMSRLLVTGRVLNGNPGSKLRESKVIGPAVAPTSGETALVTNFTNAGDIEVTFCDLIPQTPNYRTDGIKGHRWTADRVYVSKTVDGFGSFNNASTGSKEFADTVAKGCLVDGLARFDDDGGIHSDGSHNDGWQGQGGRNHLVWGCRFRGFSVAGDYTDGRVLSLGQGLIMSPNVNEMTGVVWYQNWLEGFGAQLKLKSSSYPNSSVQPYGNRHHAESAWLDGTKRYLVRVGTDRPLLVAPPTPAGGFPLPDAVDLYGMEVLDDGTPLTRVTTGAGIYYDGTTY